MLKVNLVLIVLMALGVNSVSINKCCPRGKYFEDILTCMKTNASKSLTSNLKFDVNYDVLPCNDGQLKTFRDDQFTLMDDGRLKTNDTLYSQQSFCLEFVDQNNVEAFVCPCIDKLCIRKCCFANEHIVGNACELIDPDHNLIDWHHSTLNGSKITQDHEIAFMLRNCDENENSLYLEGEYELRDDGSILSDDFGVIQPEDYCGEYRADSNTTRKIVVLACVGPPISSGTNVFAAFAILGALIMILTTLIQIFCPDMPWLSSRMLVLQTSSLTVAYIALAINSLANFGIASASCSSVGYIMQFSFLAAFFWLNVMCIDMSWTFSGIRPPSGSQNERERRKFVWYSIYAWGGASLLTLTAIVVDFTPGVPQDSVLKPNIGVIKCWFKEKEALWLYFYGPMGILLLTNLVLFVYTSIRILILKRGTSALHQADSARHGRGNKNKQRFVLYAKLFLLMGVTWLTEIISWAVGNSTVLNYLWYITDMINLLRAVFIFIIFCWKPRVWNNVKKKMPCLKQCENFVKQRCCGTNSSQDVQDEQKTTSTTQKESETSRIDVIEMQAK
ncbi:G-protein coupled receptor Mth2-like isoform X2 [Arctopsyche grandis]|uniref:G-protein coupled receptor Mth2-like isoform X2 n=1 Tax=Arctopsyche grandis TaxID=121162 RepID=UPI00406D7722